MQPVFVKFRLLLLLSGVSFSLSGQAITVGGAPSKEAAKPPTEENEENEEKKKPPTPILQAASVHRVGGADANEPGRMELTLSLQFHTPFIAETDFESRFRAWGGGLLVSIPLFDISLRAFVHLEVGALGTFTRVEIPAETYNHGYVDFPLRLRFLYPLTDDSRTSWIGELVLGPTFRFFEFDNSSAQTEGPLLFDGSAFLEPDMALGISRGLGSHLRARLLLGIQYLAVAAEFSF